jgi:phosphopantetheinyl transferase
MPIFFQNDSDQNTKLGIWKIEEEEGFFLEKVMPQRKVSHPHKKLQHLAGRYLLKYLFPGFPTQLILIADTRKPYLKDEAYHFSISHCGNYAAAIVSKTKRVGVDIEVPTPKVEKIKPKFLGNEEPALVNELFYHPRTDHELLTLLWSCKEAVYKWYGAGKVDFKEHIVIEKIKQTSAERFQAQVCFKKEAPGLLILEGRFFKEIVISYVVSGATGQLA